MRLLQKRTWRMLAWFIAGLLSALALVGLSAVGQPANATMNQTDTPAVQLDVPPTVPTSFADLVATHQEPNFYN